MDVSYMLVKAKVLISPSQVIVQSSNKKLEKKFSTILKNEKII